MAAEDKQEHPGLPVVEPPVRRLSWCDEGPPLSARPLADEIPIPTEGPALISIDAALKELITNGEADEQTLGLGILRQGSRYGLTTPLPEGITAAELVPPVPERINAKIDEALALCLEVEYPGEGRYLDTLRVKVTGAKKSHLLVHVEAKSMPSRDGRPSSVREDLRLIRSASSVSEASEGAEWKRGEGLAQGEQEQGSP